MSKYKITAARRKPECPKTKADIVAAVDLDSAENANQPPVDSSLQPAFCGAACICMHSYSRSLNGQLSALLHLDLNRGWC